MVVVGILCLARNMGQMSEKGRLERVSELAGATRWREVKVQSVNDQLTSKSGEMWRSSEKRVGWGWMALRPPSRLRFRAGCRSRRPTLLESPPFE